MMNNHHAKAAALLELHESLPLKRAVIEIEAELLIHRYKCLVLAGFTDTQAMELLKCPTSV